MNAGAGEALDSQRAQHCRRAGIPSTWEILALADRDYVQGRGHPGKVIEAGRDSIPLR